MKRTKTSTSQPIASSGWMGPLLLTLFFLSGSCGLIYEIVWMKLLTQVFGNTVFSITTILTSFMGGLALGSLAAGRLADRMENPVRTYGILEGVIGAYALLLPVLIAGTEPLFRFVYQNLHTSVYTFGLLRFLVCGTILLIPTTLMGATLPVLGRYFVQRQTHLGWTVGKLYGVNTLGAVLGSFAAGFLLIPLLGGIRVTIGAAAFLNLAIAAVVLILDGKGFWVKSGSEEEKVEPKKSRSRNRAGDAVLVGRSPLTIAVVLAAIGLSGLASMMYQISWTRVLSLLIGSSVYAFSLIVTAFICGLALGSLILGKFIDRRRDLILGLAFLEAGIGLSALLMIPVLGRLPVLIVETVATFLESFRSLQVAEFAIIFILMLIPTFMMGAAFPMATKICATDVGQAGRFMGTVYAWNTLGAIVGSFVTGFLLIPAIGTQRTIFAAVAVNFIAAGVIFLQAPRFSLVKRSGLALITVVIVVLAAQRIPSWDSLILTSGPYLYADLYKDVSARNETGLEEAMREGRQLLFFREGLHSAVAVKRTAEGDLALDINGKTDATAKGDASTQLMAGHLPLLLHPGAQDVLVIGLGSGMTLGAVELYPVKRVDLVEIEAAVVEASQYFKAFTGDALKDPRVNLMVADGRSHVAFTNRGYDVIISEPSNPWISGIANLFTQEFFKSARGRLRKGGVMCQWLQAYSMSSLDFKTVLNTFHAAFPHTSVWEASLGSDYLLIGSEEELNVDPEVLSSGFGDERIRADLVKMGTADLASFMERLLMTEGAVAEYTEGAPLHTDDNASLEYSAPRALLGTRSVELLEDLYRQRSEPGAILKTLGGGEAARSEEDFLRRFEARREVMAGYISVVRGAETDAIRRFQHALTLNPGDDDAAYLLAQLYYVSGNGLKSSGRLAEALTAYESSAQVIDEFLRGNQASLTDHFDLDSVYALSQLELGVLYLNSDSLGKAAEAFQKSTSGAVHYAPAHTNLGVIFERQGRDAEASQQYRRAIEINPNHVSALVNLGNVSLRKKEYDQAVESYLQARKLRPDLPTIHYNLGVVYFQQGRLEDASEQWERTLELNPDFKEALSSLKVIRDRIRNR